MQVSGDNFYTVTDSSKFFVDVELDKQDGGKIPCHIETNIKKENNTWKVVVTFSPDGDSEQKKMFTIRPIGNKKINVGVFDPDYCRNPSDCFNVNSAELKRTNEDRKFFSLSKCKGSLLVRLGENIQVTIATNKTSESTQGE